MDNYEERTSSTYALTLYRHKTEIEGKEYSIDLWDTAGQERYRTITNAYYRGADGIIVVFDLTSRESFLNLTDWLDEVKKSAPEDTLIIAFANKWDMYDERQVSEEEVKNFEAKTGIQVIETSAKSSENVEKGFLWLTSKLIDKRIHEGDSTSSAFVSGPQQDAPEHFGLKMMNLKDLKDLKDSISWWNT